MNLQRTSLARSSGALLAALALVVAAGCASTHRPPGVDNVGLVTGRLASVNPLDIVVLPIENSSGRTTAPLDALRRSFHAGLVKLRYSPLALDYVDRQVVEATYNPGDLHEEAVLQVFLTGWDDTHWKTNGRLVVDADVYLLDARSPDVAQALWGGHVSRRLDLQQERATLATESAQLERAAERFATEVLASLPPRNPELAAAH